MCERERGAKETRDAPPLAVRLEHVSLATTPESAYAVHGTVASPLVDQLADRFALESTGPVRSQPGQEVRHETRRALRRSGTRVATTRPRLLTFTRSPSSIQVRIRAKRLRRSRTVARLMVRHQCLT